MVDSIQYERLKKKALDLPIIRKVFPIGELKILDVHIKDREYIVKLDGIELGLKQEAWKDLLGLLRINDTLLKGLDASVGPQLKLKLLNAVKSALASSSKSVSAMFIISPERARIERILKTNINLLTPQSFFELFENQMNFKGRLELSEIFVNDNGTLDMNIMSPNDAFNVGGLATENFYPGVSLSSNYINGTAASGYTFRNVCTNGMILLGKDSTTKLKGTGDKEIMAFLKSLEEREKLGWKPAWHDDRVLKAMRTYASVGEALACVKVIENTSFDATQIIPLSSTYEEYTHMGVLPADLHKHSDMPVDMKVWELVNRMTDFASHAQGAGATNRSFAMKTAGMIFSKPMYDTETRLPLPSFFKAN